MSMDDFRNQILSNSEKEIVEINQRDLIDKILARYSSKFVIYRELMQNSDDAESKKVQIKFETEKNKDKVIRILYRNNGFPFRPEDWERLKKIAKGNPDEKKIGAFGVGFYSLFNVCEEPFVISGGQGMVFRWNDDKLYTQRGERESANDDWTTFYLDMREPEDLPNVEEFARFLTNSLGFMENLQEISVHFNDTLVIQLSKKIRAEQFAREMEISPEFNRFSPQNLFYLNSVVVRDIRLDVKFLVFTDFIANQYYGTTPPPIYLKIASGNLDVRADDEFSTKMKRITKKELPRETTIQMIYTSFDEQNSSGDYISPIFKDLLPYPEQGKIYIGFSTHQTTGCCSHLSARVIPTVERESIDLADKTLAKYNGEILSLAGTLCRILYEYEINQINKRIGDDIENREWFEKRAAHALTHFAFNPSTPNEKVGEIIESQFFNCSKKKLTIFSTNGLLPISDVRIPNSEMAGFIKTVPLVPTIVFEQCEAFFKKAKNSFNMIRELDFQDVLFELNNRVLSENEMIDLLKWWISYGSEGNIINRSESERFMELARFDNSKSLKSIRNFLNPGIIPPRARIPNYVLPYSISKHFKTPKDIKDLKKYLEWSELSLVNWARFIANSPELETDFTFAEEVHEILARSFSKITSNDKKVLHQLFEQRKCIPTNFGMKIPNEAYFKNVTIFPNLPTIKFQKHLLIMDILVEHLGVRKVVEINLIIDRLINHEDCDYMQLIKYLASKSDDLEPKEKDMLKNNCIWPKENSTQHLSIGELHIPLELHRELGLPVIEWKTRWTLRTPEEKFLIDLGIQSYPKLKKILELAAHPADSDIRYKALKYFMNNFDKKYSKNYYASEIGIAFLPCLNNNYAKPLECYINPECTAMNFKVIRQDLRHQVGKFGVRQHPSREELLNKLLQNPPQDEDNAEEIFEYLASQITVFNRSDWNRLSKSNFIPARNQRGEVILTNSYKCFFKVQDELKNFFLLIDYGDNANKFLQSCGVKNEPSSIDYAELLIKSSRAVMYSIGVEKYLNILRTIASEFSNNFSIMSKLGLVSEMRKTPILVGITKETREIDSETKEINIYHLESAKKIYIYDDKIYQRVFNPLTAPEEDGLEILYKDLGCKSLRESVKETSTPRGAVRMTDKSREFQEKILERASLLYYKQPKSNIKRNEEWLKNLRVREVDYLKTSYKLGNNKKVVDTKTSIIQDNETWTLYITSNSAPFDISRHIVMNIYKNYEHSNIFVVSTLLTTPLTTLKDSGYPVDRILQQHNLQEAFADQTKTNQENDKSISNVKPPIDNSSSPLHPQFNQQGLYSNANTSNPSTSNPSTSNASTSNPSTSNPNSYTNKKPINITNKNPVTITSRESVNITNREPVTITNKGPVTITNRESVTVANIELVNITNERSINITNEDSVDIKNREPIPITSESTRTLQNFIQEAIKNFYSNPKGNINNQTDTKDIIKAYNFNKGSIINHQDSVKIVHESQMNYCNIVPELHCVGIFQGVELHIPESLTQLSQELNDPLNQFIDMLKSLVDVFGLAPKDIHVFYDGISNSIAFNHNRELFFNLKFYYELHDDECKNKPTIIAMTYWFMMFCHELAHNFIQYHNSEHEYYFLLFAEIYMSDFLKMLKNREIF
ncbi:hypothetical protein RclHR1_01840007 [Rhizophagus clarus]|uniref:Sacsin/Nov domain-containing protein n=1 Tax=Rhizophagus clarus TaxID=94130 RepID=A0A2Z6QMC7_9GLOM|nr:hypothetical protein RclHR1_01840007 [Rhizophagus clarus]GES86515.1 hypothetical protein GLOIN_2v1834046 [Rhizophagus clarus]